MTGALRPALLVSAAALCVDVAWRAAVVEGPGLGVGLAFGTDAALWGLSAEGLVHGAAPAVPPAWPALVALPRALGLALVPAGALVSHLAAAAIPGLALAVARRGGAPAAAAWAVGALLMLWPDRITWGIEVQANGLGALLLLGATGLLAELLARAGRGAPSASVRGVGAVAAVGIGLLPLARDNLAAATLAGILALPLLLRGGWRTAGLIVVAWWLSPLLVGAQPGLTPLQTPWAARGATALHDLGAGAGPLPGYVAEIPRATRGLYVQLLREGDTLGLMRWHAARSLGQAPEVWAWAAAVTLAAARRGRRHPALWAALLPLAVMLPTLGLWSQRRHLTMALPALLALAATLAASARWGDRDGLAGSAAGGRRQGLAAVGLLLLGLTLSRWPAAGARHFEAARGEALRATTLAELGAWLCRQPEPLLGGPIQDVGLYCPRPRHDLDGSPADAHTLVVSFMRQAPPTPRADWVAVGPPAAELVVYRWRPDQPRPCPQGQPGPGTPYLSAGPVHAALVGCDAP